MQVQPHHIQTHKQWESLPCVRFLCPHQLVPRLLPGSIRVFHEFFLQLHFLFHPLRVLRTLYLDFRDLLLLFGCLFFLLLLLLSGRSPALWFGDIPLKHIFKNKISSKQNKEVRRLHLATTDTITQTYLSALGS